MIYEPRPKRTNLTDLDSFVTETYLTAEARARRQIDVALEAAGWILQDMKGVNLFAGSGVAVREYPVGGDRADYLLFVDAKAAGTVEAKKVGVTLTGVEGQSAKYGKNLSAEIPAHRLPLPFLYESTGTETHFTNLMDPEPRSRRLFTFHRPETLRQWLRSAELSKDGPTLRSRLTQLPPLVQGKLWPAQFKAIHNLEKSLAENRQRALAQGTTGSGKTYTIVEESYRLIKFGGARRVLFLVDRANLGHQALAEFQQYVSPDDGRKFTELYGVQLLTSNHVDDSAQVVITTVQRLYSILKGEAEFEEELDETSGFLVEPPAPVEVVYNPQIPIETFDVVVIDECHRSIYGVWRQVVEYFDAFLVGLTATPNSQALAFFEQNLVSEYTHEEAVADGVNVDFDVYLIKTRITQVGSGIEAGLVTGIRNKDTRKVRWQKLEEPYQYRAVELDRAVVAKDQIRTVVQTFKQKLFVEIFPGRTEVPKTLVFAKDDSHADDIVQVIREEFGKGNDFAAKITYRTTGKKPAVLLKEFQNSYNPRVAVTVDMIATGTNVKPLECLLFMRSVKSRTFFEQMKGRGVRVMNNSDFQAVTPDARAKVRFVIVDAVGVTETELMDTYPLDKEPTVGLERLMKQIGMGIRTPGLLSTLGSRLSRLDRIISDSDRAELKQLADGHDLGKLAASLIHASDPDVHFEHAKQDTGLEDPPAEAVANAAKALMDEAARPLAKNPPLRERICDIRTASDQVMDEASQDKVLFAGPSIEAAQRARKITTDFRKYLDDHRDEIAALQVLYSRPYKKRLSFKDIKVLANAIERPPQAWTPEVLWHAYEQLDRSKVKGSGGKMLTDIVSLVRFAIEQDAELVPYQDQVGTRFQNWLLREKQAGTTFTPEQITWLELMRDHIAASLSITTDDFDYAPFVQHGGLGKAFEVFGPRFNPLLEQLTDALAA